VNSDRHRQCAPRTARRGSRRGSGAREGDAIARDGQTPQHRERFGRIDPGSVTGDGDEVVDVDVDHAVARQRHGLHLAEIAHREIQAQKASFNASVDAAEAHDVVGADPVHLPQLVGRLVGIARHHVRRRYPDQPPDEAEAGGRIEEIFDAVAELPIGR